MRGGAGAACGATRSVLGDWHPYAATAAGRASDPQESAPERALRKASCHGAGHEEGSGQRGRGGGRRKSSTAAGGGDRDAWGEGGDSVLSDDDGGEL